MADHSTLLRSMLQDIINDNTDQATATMHDYFVAKTREVSGLNAADEYSADENDFEDNSDDE